MTPTLKQQLEQWIDREAEKQSERSVRDFGQRSDSLIVSRINYNRGAKSILPMLLVACEALEFVINHSMPNTYNNEEAHKVLNKIKSMMEGESD